MTLREFELLAAVYAKNNLLPASVAVPPGDDMAVIHIGGASLLVAVDQVVEGVHVRCNEDPALVGRKVVARNVSDVAAMAAKPVASVVACTLPTRYGRAEAETLYEGLRAAANEFNCPLIGGDTTIHRDERAPLVCSVTILAEPAWQGARVVTRRGGRVGDGVYLTGSIGGSLEPDGRGRHLNFVPRVPEAIELLKRLGDRLHALIDVSDGLGRDAAHLVEWDSAIAIEVDAARLPTRGRLWRQAIADGEDYELLFLASGEVPNEVCGTPVTHIGSVVARSGPAVGVRTAGELVDATGAGWQHGGGGGII